MELKSSRQALCSTSVLTVQLLTPIWVWTLLPLSQTWNQFNYGAPEYPKIFAPDDRPESWSHNTPDGLEKVNKKDIWTSCLPRKIYGQQPLNKFLSISTYSNCTHTVQASKQQESFTLTSQSYKAWIKGEKVGFLTVLGILWWGAFPVTKGLRKP